MTRRLKTLLTTAAAFAALAGPASAAVNLITNGGFNNGLTVAAPGGGFATLGTTSTAINDWQILDNNIDWLVGYWESADGDGYSIDLNGNNPGSIGQTIATEIGQVYHLTFFMSGNPDGGGATRVAVLGANANEIGSATYTVVPGMNTRANMRWEERTVAFIADSTSTLISFTSDTTDTNFFGAAIDNVSVTAVPEPATWALMIAGFGGAGAMIRRRRMVAA